ncbi:MULTISPECIES: hypothetical protein [Bacillaceae]|uniref:hypothetical protein n=1 Tax=Bacillaceae TaxID=186817 RepID=UPI002356D142|nr:hypothetical protein [Bacillus weihaiensis]
MPYSLKDERTPFRGGKNILASIHMQYTEEGATLDASKIGAKYLPVGTPIARNLTTGKYEVFSTATGFDDFALLNVDVDCDGKHDVFVGEVLIRASVYDGKLPATVTQEFKDLTKPLIRYVKNI